MAERLRAPDSTTGVWSAGCGFGSRLWHLLRKIAEVVLSALPARLRIDDFQAYMYIRMDCERGNSVSALGVGGNGLGTEIIVAHTLKWTSGLVCLATCIKKEKKKKKKKWGANWKQKWIYSTKKQWCVLFLQVTIDLTLFDGATSSVLILTDLLHLFLSTNWGSIVITLMLCLTVDRTVSRTTLTRKSSHSIWISISYCLLFSTPISPSRSVFSYKVLWSFPVTWLTIWNYSMRRLWNTRWQQTYRVNVHRPFSQILGRARKAWN